ncbi:SGNH/GDSL hydrolase family protein [Cryobacterium adonitolivorans]|uniref:SGNH/GDSL hydrolase family protein n=1 Tax=Cryobacterium adonitolivorans TaxID=1259189 RepID=A0A4R8WDW7_9MICO|nr:SGNH/GDSL hydrolase family protein [Cryobacterium adonitolivorans]TFC05538.1 SGNH/GDSL hydrolase family protein [Cryobacterium adonitolivorans]
MTEETKLSAVTSFRRRSLPWVFCGLVLVVSCGAVAAAALASGGGASRGLAVSTAPPAPTVSAIPVAVFVGDSYTQGLGASSPVTRWSTLVAEEAGWTEVNQGLGGTGYVTAASAIDCGQKQCPTYPDRVADVIASAPDVVVIAGGQNDRWALGTDPQFVRAAVNETFRLIRAELPNARLIAVGPSTAEPATAMLTDLDGWVQAAAHRVDAEYVSLLDPVVIRAEMVVADGVHVDDAGHRAIADRVLATALTRAD